MGDTYVISGLTSKRAEVSGIIADLEFRAFNLKRTKLQAFVLRADSRFKSIPILRDPL